MLIVERITMWTISGEPYGRADAHPERGSGVLQAAGRDRVPSESRGRRTVERGMTRTASKESARRTPPPLQEAVSRFVQSVRRADAEKRAGMPVATSIDEAVPTAGETNVANDRVTRWSPQLTQPTSTREIGANSASAGARHNMNDHDDVTGTIGAGGVSPEPRGVAV